jgi:hypothetical protein
MVNVLWMYLVTFVLHFVPCPNIRNRAATLAKECRQYKSAWVFCGGAGEFWGIKGAAEYDDVVQQCLATFRQWGVHASESDRSVFWGYTWFSYISPQNPKTPFVFFLN